MLLRKTHSLKPMSYLLLEFSTYIFRLDDLRQLKPWTGDTTPGESSGSERGCSIFFLLSLLFNNLSSKPRFLFFLPLELQFISKSSLCIQHHTISSDIQQHNSQHTHTHTHTLTESLESRELQILLLSHSPSHLAGHRDVSPPSHLYVTPSTRA